MGCLPCDDFRIRILFIWWFCHLLYFKIFYFQLASRGEKIWDGPGQVMIYISLFCWPELKTWPCAISRVAGICSLTVCTERKGIDNSEHGTVSQSAQASGYQMSLHFSREHLSLAHGSQPKDPSFSASSSMCRNSGSHMSYPWGPCVTPYNLVTYALWGQVFCLLTPVTHPTPTSISHVHCKRRTKMMKSCWAVLVKDPYGKWVWKFWVRPWSGLWEKLLCALFLVVPFWTLSLRPYLKLVWGVCSSWGLPILYYLLSATLGTQRLL